MEHFGIYGDNNQRVDEARALAGLEGSARLDGLPSATLQVLLSWYREQFVQLEETEKVDYLEEFIQQGLISDDEACGYAEDFSSESREKIGLFLGHIMETTEWVATFQECWMSLDFEEQAFFKDFFTRIHPAQFPIVAPFIFSHSKDLRTVVTENKPGAAAVNKAVSVPDEFYQSAADTRPLFDSLLSYYEEHPERVVKVAEEHITDDKRASMRLRIRDYDGRKDPLRSWVEYYTGKGSIQVLLPYIERLYALGEITSAERDSLYTPKYDSWGDTLLLRHSREANLRESKLRVGMHDVTHSQYDHGDVGYNYAPFEHMRPRVKALGLQAAIAQGFLQEGEALLQNFQTYKAHLGDSEDFILGAKYAGYPVLRFVDSLGLTKSDVAKLFKKIEEEGNSPLSLFDGSEVRSILALDKSDTEGASLEQVLIEHISQLLLRDQYDRGVLVGLIIYIESWLGEFTDAGRQKLLQTINDKNPAIWVYNPAFALSYTNLSGSELIKRCATDPKQFFYEYQYFRHGIAQSTVSEADKKLLLSEAEREFISLVEQYPLLLVDTKQGLLVESLLGREKIIEIFRQLIREPLDDTVMNEIICSKYFEELHQDFHDLIIEKPHIFSFFTKSHNRCDKLKILLNRQEIIALIKEQFSTVGLGTLFSEPHINFFTRDEVRYFITLATQSGHEHQLHELAFQLYRYEESRNKSHDELQSRRDDLNSKRTLLVSQLRQANNDNYGTVADMQAKLDQTKKIMLAVKQQQLEQATVRPFTEECDTARGHLEILCQKDSSLVFSKEVLRVLGERAYPFIIQHIDEYATKNPMVLSSERYNGGFGEEVEAAVGKEHFNELLKKHSRFLVSQRQVRPGRCEFRYTNLRGPEIKELFESMDPFNAVNQTEGRVDDYYDFVLGGIRSMAYYPFLERSLERIAQEQQKTHGTQTDNIVPPEEFADMVQLIALLEHSPLALSVAPDVALLPTQEQRVAMESLSIAARYNLDDVYGDEIPTVETFQETTVRLFSERLAKYLEIPVHYINDSLSFNTLTAFGEFFQTALKENSEAGKAFAATLEALTIYEYKDWKHWGEVEPTDSVQAEALLQRLKVDKLVPSEVSIDIYQLWSNTTDKPFDEVLTYEIGDVVHSIGQILANALADGHITDEFLSKSSIELESDYERLMEPLKRITSELGQYTEIIKNRRNGESEATGEQTDYDKAEQEFRRLKEAQQDYREREGAAIATVTAQLYLNRLRHLTTHELKNGAVLFAKKEVKFDRVFKAILEVFQDEFPGINEDIYRIQQVLTEGRKNVFGETKVSRKKLTITDQDEFETNFNIGQHPVPSCQSYASTMGFNEGLLSYVSDPSVRVVQVWDEDNRLIARGVMRLMEDKNKRPALFVERVYSVNAHHKITEAILSFAKAKADSMGIAVYTTENEKVASKGVSALFNCGTRSSATYSDAGGGLVKGGAFKVPLAREI